MVTSLNINLFIIAVEEKILRAQSIAQISVFKQINKSVEHETRNNYNFEEIERFVGIRNNQKAILCLQTNTRI